jgi:hypothetical protein
MKQIILTSNDLIKFMGKDKYYEFIDYLKTKNYIPKEVPLWIILEWSSDEKEK